MSKRGFQALIAILGLVALIAGGVVLIWGAASVPASGSVHPNVDSELRFFAAWYATAGVLLLRAVPRPENSATLVRAVGGAFFLAGSARGLSSVTVGVPDAQFLVLMGVELVLPLVLIPWQAALQRKAVTSP